MAVRSARRIDGVGMVFAVCCDVCHVGAERTIDQLHDDGWFFEGTTPHQCPACALVRAAHLHGDLVHSRAPAAA
jgi:rubrerythrin